MTDAEGQGPANVADGVPNEVALPVQEPAAAIAGWVLAAVLLPAAHQNSRRSALAFALAVSDALESVEEDVREPSGASRAEQAVAKAYGLMQHSSYLPRIPSRAMAPSDRGMVAGTELSYVDVHFDVVTVEAEVTVAAEVVVGDVAVVAM